MNTHLVWGPVAGTLCRESDGLAVESWVSPAISGMGEGLGGHGDSFRTGFIAQDALSLR